MKRTFTVTTTPDPIRCELHFGENLLEDALRQAERPILITTSAIAPLLPKFEIEKIVLPDGEAIKSRAMKERVEDALIERGCGRDTTLLAVGGGVLLDLVGFVASTYCRGITYITFPSTLLAMTDVAIGGKTGINVAEAKNWIGAFYPPKRAYIDFVLLESLPQREFTLGFCETIKHGLIAERSLFEFVEQNQAELLLRNTELLKEMVFQSCQVKQRIVESDPFERKGLRRILNFGHTVGHALETLSDYTLSHGQAVMMGMLVEASVARELGYLSNQAFERIRRFIDLFPVRLDFPDRLPYEMMYRDKKGAHNFVVLSDIGSVAACEGEYVTFLSEEVFDAAWNAIMCPH